MSTLTPNYSLIKPGVNDPTDQDLWGGYLNDDLDIIDAQMKQNSDRATLPVGSLYFNASVATNPASLFGYGTWTAFGEGRVLLGAGTGTDINAVQETFAAGDTGGEYEHVQTLAELAAHEHTVGEDNNTDNVNTNPANLQVGRQGAPPLGTGDTGTAGSSTAMPWMQPYITVYIWRRTA